MPRIRPPLAPIGCPSATAPPLTFAVSGSAPSICTRVERNRREGLVHLDPLDVADRLARLLERLRARIRRRAREPRELVGHVALRHDRRQRLEPAPLRELLGADDDAGGAVVDARRVAGRDRPLGIHRRLQTRRASRASCRAAPTRRRSPRRRERSRRRSGLRPARPRHARASGTPTRPDPRARCRARGRPWRPAPPCAARRTSSAARPRSSDRPASRRPSGSPSAPSAARTARSSSTPCRR